MTLQLTKRGQKQALPEALVAQFGETLARVLMARGVATDKDLHLEAQELLPADTLLGLQEAVARLDEAIDRQEKILVVGDFDCDGATSTALVVRVLRIMGATVDFLIPDRFVFGYGLTCALVQHAFDSFTPALIITVDNGISSHDGVALAYELGMEVIITDHHLTTEAAPDACAVVNPNQLGCTFASKALVGVGVAFYVMGALAKVRRAVGKSTAMVSQYLDLVALGTVADVGVLDKNNRILVAHGLARVRAGNCVPGILALLAGAGRDCQAMTVSDFGFAIAPRINAAGRMDNMRVGVACLLADDWQSADDYARQLNALNIERQQTQAVMRDTAERMLDNLQLDATRRAVILYDDDWHQGVIGVVAGRIKEQTYLPTLIFAPADRDKTGDNDLIKASARSIKGVHMRDTILQVARRYPQLICHFGGHAMAAGLTLHKKDFANFCTAFYAAMAEFPDSIFCAERLTDGTLAPHEISLAFAEQLQQLSIWGHGFAEPTFDGVFAVKSARILKDKHLKLLLAHPEVPYPIDAIWFNYEAAAWDYRATNVHVLYKLAINEWRGNRRVQFIVQALALID